MLSDMLSTPLLALTMGAGIAFAAPAPGYYEDPFLAHCEYFREPITVNTRVFDGEPKLMAYTCTSSKLGTCSLTNGAVFSHSTSWSVGGGIDAKFKLSSVFELAPKFQFGYSWTDTEASVQSGTVTCPPGGMKCGVLTTPSFCELTGRAEVRYLNDQWPELLCQHPRPPRGEQSDYLATSACMVDKFAVADFEPCVLECNLKEDGCDHKLANQMKPCPGVKFPFPGPESCKTCT